MFDDILKLDEIEAIKLYDFLYKIFYNDFIKNRTYLKHIYINPKKNQKIDGKEKVFWHLTTKTQKYQIKEGNSYKIVSERLLDYKRSKRLHWVKKIIENYFIDEIKIFYYREKSNKIRLYLWLHNKDFVVILEKLGKTDAYLVTSFYIDRKGKRKDFERRYQDYIDSKDINLKGCEWF